MKSISCIMFSSVGHFTVKWGSFSRLTLEYCLRRLNLWTILTDGATDNVLYSTPRTELFSVGTHTSRASIHTHRYNLLHTTGNMHVHNHRKAHTRKHTSLCSKLLLDHAGSSSEKTQVTREKKVRRRWEWGRKREGGRTDRDKRVLSCAALYSHSTLSTFTQCGWNNIELQSRQELEILTH